MRIHHSKCVQVDGGAENANQYVLAALELLVVKRIVKEVYYSRLPTTRTPQIGYSTSMAI